LHKAPPFHLLLLDFFAWLEAGEVQSPTTPTQNDYCVLQVHFTAEANFCFTLSRVATKIFWSHGCYIQNTPGMKFFIRRSGVAAKFLRIFVALLEHEPLVLSASTAMLS
jgi:hypothetical protein